MWNINTLLFSLFSLISVGTGQVIQRGQCDPIVQAVANFDAERYLGVWYDVESYTAPFQTGTCPTATYSLNEDGLVNLVNAQVQNQLLQSFAGTAKVVSQDGRGELEVSIKVGGANGKSILWVLGTDYNSYALAYSCTNLDAETRAVTSWKVSRTPTLTSSADTAINALINTVSGLDQQHYIKRSHTEEDCFYYPDYILDGQCIESDLIPAVTNFNFNSFAGTWYEVSRYSSGFQTGDCVANLFTTSGANTYTVTQTSVNSNRLSTISTQATIANGGRGVINFNVNGVPLSEIYILGTDYTEYALIYGCRNINSQQKQIYSWKLSKSQTGLSDSADAMINALISNNVDLNERYYRVTGQDNKACYYYPEFEELPENIIIPFPCPDDIRGMADFVTDDYLGRWFETARYPTTYHKGQCNRGDYSALELPQPHTFISFNEVINETLVTHLATAQEVEDSSGHFIVEVEDEAGVSRKYDYYVLATDYTSYSLVYSCANLDGGTSIVNAWKLSRTTSLSPEASAAINTVIANTQGISQQYFQATSQSDDDCFYIPPLNTQLAPRFRGQCADITGVAEFDIDKYLGWWHELESYPNVLSGGNCRSSIYSAVDTAYRVEDVLVRNNSGVYIRASVTATNNGRLRRTIIGNIFQDIWVLATDYKTYSLLYSCVNLNNEYRSVWSAIHSKSRDPISEEIRAAIAPLIANNRVLIEQFYLPVEHSDEACFHYPSDSFGDIIIPGQCDPNIPVVENFNVDEFAGNWFHIESYEDLRSSSCVGSQFSVDEAGTIDVLYYQVLTNQLQTVNGTATLVSSDETARIELTFPIDGSEDERTTTVYVLATDYTTYALAYSCNNVNAYQRQVRAWKLSRQRTLHSASNAAINAIIEQREELHQPYFKRIQQNANCPTPNTALILKSSIIMLFTLALLLRLA